VPDATRRPDARPQWACRVASLLPGALAVLAAVAVLAITAYRLRLSLNFTDEAFYLALPLRFLRGDRMFVDELNYLQFWTVLTIPIVWLWTKIVGLTGLVLFMRFVYLAFECVVAGSLFMMFKRIIKWPYALVAVLTIPAFIPWGVPSLSYNTLGIGLLALGLVAGCFAVLHDDRRWLFASGLAHGLAIVAYPTLLLVAFAYAIIVCVRRRDAWFLQLFAYVGGLAVIGVPTVIALLVIGPNNLLEAFRFSTALGTQGGGFAKLALVASQAFGSLIHARRLGALVLILVVARFFKHPAARWVSCAVLVLLPFQLPSITGFDSVAFSMGMIAYWGILVLVVYGVSQPDEHDRLVFWHLAVPSLVAGLGYVYSSNNGFLNAGYGLAPAAVATTYFAMRYMQRAGSESGIREPWPGVVAMVPALLLTGFVMQTQFRWFYNDTSLADLRHPVSTGAYAGLRTGAENAEVLKEMQADLKRFSRPGDRVLFFDGFPGGYLLSDLPAATDTVWLASPTLAPQMDASRILQYWRESGKTPTLVFRIRMWGLTYGTSHPIMGYLTDQGFQPVAVRAEYDVYRRPGSAVGVPVK
jgi:hypothetical protein